MTLGLAALALAAVALGVALLLLVRFSRLANGPSSQVEPALSRLDQGLREELLRGRSEAAASAKLLREEVTARLEQGFSDKFKVIGDRVDQVIKSVGEMQQLASSVGDLKRVLSNVKARGTWAEVSLGALLEEALAPEQYARNVEIRPGSGQRVEFAIRLPGADGGGPFYLPIDAKFPTEDYERLAAAADRADAAAIEEAARRVERRIVQEARAIGEKYVAPPHSTDFALMFLPTEGLYAEVLRRPGLADRLQRDCRIVIAGPTTLLALLNSLRMGFRTLAIQQRTGEVWQLLGAVKTEFGRYGAVLDQVQKKLGEASNALDTIGTRRRAVDRKLAGVEALPEDEARLLLGLDPGGEPPPLADAAED